MLWQRPDLTQTHLHYSRTGGLPRMDYQTKNSQLYWTPDQQIFFAREKQNFPGHEVIDAV